MQRLPREMEDRIYKRGEPIKCYYYDKLTKARRRNLSEQACIEYLITSLNNKDIIRAISTRTYDSTEELLHCLKRLHERVRTVGSRHSSHSKASGFKTLASHCNKDSRAAEAALNEYKHNQQYSELRSETEPFGPRRKHPPSEKAGPRCFNCNKYGQGIFQLPESTGEGEVQRLQPKWTRGPELPGKGEWAAPLSKRCVSGHSCSERGEQKTLHAG
ncbi:hypothetical protein MRX96_035336 [Rhipicephalus microplus]